jgi:transposase
VPIKRAGYHPPGLLNVGDSIFRQGEVLSAEARLASGEGRQIRLVNEGTLIEEIMRPYPTARLRTRRQREAMERLVENQAAQWRREDATKCNTLQQK